MSIEQTLERIAVALETLANRAVALSQPMVSAAPDSVVPTAAPSAPAKPRGRPPGSTKVATPTVEPALAVDSTPAPDPFATETPVPLPALPTKEQVRAALVGYQSRLQAAGNPKAGELARDVLVKVGGVDTLAVLPESKWAAVIAAANAGK